MYGYIYKHIGKLCGKGRKRGCKQRLCFEPAADRRQFNIGNKYTGKQYPDFVKQLVCCKQFAAGKQCNGNEITYPNYGERTGGWEEFYAFRDALKEQAQASPEYEQRKTEYLQYSDMLAEFLKRPEIMELCNAANYSVIEVHVYLQDYNLDNVPEVVISYSFLGKNTYIEERLLICDLKTGKIMGALYNSKNYIYIGKNENGSEYVFVEESLFYATRIGCTMWSRLALVDESAFVRDRYLYAEYYYFGDNGNPLLLQKWYIDIPLEEGNSYMPSFCGASRIFIKEQSGESEITQEVIIQCFKDREVRIEKSVSVGSFKAEFDYDNNTGKIYFEADKEFKGIESDIEDEYAGIALEELSNDAIYEEGF